MSADWIKMRMDLQSHPKVVRIMSATMSDKFRVIGGLHAVWSVFDQHSEDGKLFGYTPDLLNQIIGWDGFADAMVSVEWLQFDGDKTLAMPEFTEHNGQSAKRRAEDQKRKKLSRSCPQNVRNESEEEEDKKKTREEKEKNKDKKTLSGNPDEASEVIAYLNEKTGSSYRNVDSNIRLVSARIREGATVEQIKSVIDAKVEKWGGDPKMEQYLRPATLFGATNFESYLGQIGKVSPPVQSASKPDFLRGAI